MNTQQPILPEGAEPLVSPVEIFAKGWKRISVVAIGAGILGYCGALMIPPTYTARALIIPPQQQQGGMAAALGSLGAIAGLAGGAAGLKNPLDQYVSLMQSETVIDKLIDEFRLLDVYRETYRVDARRKLSSRTAISAGKKDGLITIEVEDGDPVRAAKMAGAYIAGLKFVLSKLALTEAQQRRQFFEEKLREAKSQLAHSQADLEASGFNPGAIKTEPRAAVEEYARLRTEIVAAEIRLQTMRRNLTDGSPEIQQQQSMLSALRSQLAKIEGRGREITGNDGYVSKYREFKYQETLFELYARQYELARVDESREGAIVQVVDAALPPEKRSKPKRSVIAMGAAAGGALLAMLHLLYRRRGT